MIRSVKEKEKKCLFHRPEITGHLLGYRWDFTTVTREDFATILLLREITHHLDFEAIYQID